ncbi:MAG: hypothetical protein WCI03_03680 [bacterium]
MTFEASTTLTPGSGITARLTPGANRVDIEVIGHPAPEAVVMAVPRVLQLLADKARLPVRHGGQVYRPVPTPALNFDVWGEGKTETISGGIMSFDEQKLRIK